MGQKQITQSKPTSDTFIFRECVKVRTPFLTCTFRDLSPASKASRACLPPIMAQAASRSNSQTLWAKILESQSVGRAWWIAESVTVYIGICLMVSFCHTLSITLEIGNLEVNAIVLHTHDHSSYKIWPWQDHCERLVMAVAIDQQWMNTTLVVDIVFISIYLSIYLAIYPSIYLSIYL